MKTVWKQEKRIQRHLGTSLLPLPTSSTWVRANDTTVPCVAQVGMDVAVRVVCVVHVLEPAAQGCLLR